MIALALVLLVPAVALAGSVFDDVDDTDTHIEGITFMKDSGVSVGCDANNNYCPQDNVTRAQMATFMYRLSGNDPATEASVNADSVDGSDAEDLQVLVFQGTDLDACSSLTAATDCGSVVVDAPVPGVVIVSTTASANTFGEGTRVVYGVSDTSATLLDTVALAGVIDGSDTLRRSYSLAHEHVFTVDAGSHTFYAVGDRPSPFDSASVNVFDVELTAVFVPTG